MRYCSQKSFLLEEGNIVLLIMRETLLNKNDFPDRGEDLLLGEKKGLRPDGWEHLCAVSDIPPPSRAKERNLVGNLNLLSKSANTTNLFPTATHLRTLLQQVQYAHDAGKSNPV